MNNNEMTQVYILEELFNLAKQNPDNPLWKYERIKNKYLKMKFFISWKCPALTPARAACRSFRTSFMEFILGSYYSCVNLHSEIYSVSSSF